MARSSIYVSYIGEAREGKGAVVEKGGNGNRDFCAVSAGLFDSVQEYR